MTPARRKRAAPHIERATGLRALLRRERVVIRSLLLLATLFSLYVASMRWLGGAFNDGLTRALAWLTAGVLSSFGVEAHAEGACVATRDLDMQVIGECTAVYVMGLYAAAVLAYPAGWRPKLAGTVIGLFLIQAVNLVRLVTLFYIGWRHPDWLEIAHMIVWQSLMVFCAVFLWTIWASGVERYARAPA